MQSAGEKGMDEKQEKDECGSELISRVGRGCCLDVSYEAWWLSDQAWPSRKTLIPKQQNIFQWGKKKKKSDRKTGERVGLSDRCIHALITASGWFSVDTLKNRMLRMTPNRKGMKINIVIAFTITLMIVFCYKNCILL